MDIYGSHFENMIDTDLPCAYSKKLDMLTMMT